ncbi:MAG: serine/threonine-protein phosphatase [Lachnospiraceae bacterium]|nr:serine/threonine-protein phosphatase [Lachnospiraceae bacterium]
MQKKGKLRSSMIFRIAGGNLLLIILFGWLLGIIGYLRFTESVTAEYNDAAFRAAETARAVIDAGRIDDWLASGGADEDYKEAARVLDILCVKQGVTLIYLIDVDTSDYGRFVSVFNSVGEDTGYEPWPIGYERDTTNEEYRDIYRNIYENGLERGTVVRTKNLNGRDPHITSLMPVKLSDGSVRAILCVQRPMEELAKGHRLYLEYVAVAMIFTSVVALFISVSFMKREFVEPLQTLSSEASRFAEESTEPEEGVLKDISSISEIELLASSLEKMELDTLQNIENIRRITAEKERIGAELSVAAQIQSDMLPKTFPAYPDRSEFDIYALMQPAREVGGDFYDFFFVDDSHLALVMSDVSDKGIPAALFMVICRTLIKKQAQSGESGYHTSKILSVVNEQICEGNDADMFATVWIGILDLNSGKGIASNAGHEHPLISRNGGAYELECYPHSAAIGMRPGLDFEEHEFELKAGDSLLVYTDGVAEANNADRELFGTERVIEELNRDPLRSAEELIRSLRSAIDGFTGGARQFDDITMLAFRYLGPVKKD